MQSIQTSANMHAAGQGTGAGKEIAGRECHLGADVLGLLPVGRVTAAGVFGDAGGIRLLSRIADPSWDPGAF
ncbi:hypothetical protein [Streptomyces sp. NPDC005009]